MATTKLGSAGRQWREARRSEGNEQSPNAGAGIRQVHRPKHHREDCDRADCSDALFQVLKGIAAKHQLFRQCPEQKNEQYGPDPRQSVHTEAKPGAGMPPNRDRNNRQDRQHESDEAADGELLEPAFCVRQSQGSYTMIFDVVAVSSLTLPREQSSAVSRCPGELA